MTSVLHFHFHTQIEHMTWNKEMAFNFYLTYCVTQHCLTINYTRPCINLCGQWILFYFSAQVHTKFHCRQAHIPGSDTSCLSFSYDGMTLASRGGKKNILTYLPNHTASGCTNWGCTHRHPSSEPPVFRSNASSKPMFF